jgi:hypothetical protein
LINDIIKEAKKNQIEKGRGFQCLANLLHDNQKGAKLPAHNLGLLTAAKAARYASSRFSKFSCILPSLQL